MKNVPASRARSPLEKGFSLNEPILSRRILSKRTGANKHQNKVQNRGQNRGQNKDQKEQKKDPRFS
jgi:hypothetical protein